MKYFVYTVVYDDQGNVLVGKKNEKGYFFHCNKGGVIIKTGQLLNTAKKWVFPGGELEAKDEVAGALKEFSEETNIDLNDKKYEATPKMFTGSHKKNITYYGVYLKVDSKTLKVLQSEISKNLQQAEQAVSDIQKNNDIDYTELMKKYERCPCDNELKEIKVKTIKDILEDWKDDKEVDWFVEIVKNLEKYLKN